MVDHKPPGKLRFLTFGLLAIALLWAIVTHSLVAVLVRIDPFQAVMLRSDDPAVLTALADRTIDAIRREKAAIAKKSRFDFKAPTDPLRQPLPKSGPNGEEALPRSDEDAIRQENLRTWASTILAQEPGNVRALAILAELERTAGEEQKAATLLRAIAQRTLRDPVPHAWLIHEAIRQMDWPQVMRHADILMTMHQQSVRPLTPLIAHLAETGEAAPIVRDALLAAPPWRSAFLLEMLNAISDVRTPLDLLLAMKEAGTPPRPSELRAYLGFLIHRRYFDLAYYTWLQFLPPQQLATVGPLFNGSFETPPSGVAFDWQIPVRGTASVSISRRPDRPSERALVVNFGHGRVELGPTSQLLRLRPGRYRLSGEVMGEVFGRRGVRWRAECVAQKTREIGESEMFVGEIKEWTGFEMAIDVPDADCPAQTLTLTLDVRLPAERLITGSIWFDGLSIRREPETPIVQPPTASPPPQSQPRQR